MDQLALEVSKALEVKLSSFFMETKHTQLLGRLASARQLSVWEYIISSRSRKKHLGSCVAPCHCVMLRCRTLSAKQMLHPEALREPCGPRSPRLITRLRTLPFAGSFTARVQWIACRLLVRILWRFTRSGLPRSQTSPSLATRHLHLVRPV